MYLVYLPDVGGPSKPLIQKDVGRRPARLPNDQEEDQSRNPRRRRAYNGIAGTEHLEVRHDRRERQRRVELAEDRSRGHVSGRYVRAAAAASSRRAWGITSPLQWSWRP